MWKKSQKTFPDFRFNPVKVRLILGTFGLGLFFSFALLFFFYHLVFSKRVIPGVNFAGRLDLSGKSYSESLKRIDGLLSRYFQGSLTLRLSEHEESFTMPDFGLSFDASESARRAFSVGRSRRLLSDLLVELRTLLVGVKVAPIVKVDEEKMKTKLLEIERGLAGREASFNLSGGEISVVAETEGLIVTEAELRRKIIEDVSFLENEFTIEFPSLKPSITAKKLNELLGEVRRADAAKPIIGYGNKSWEIDDPSFLSLIDLRESSPAALVASAKELAALSGRIAAEIDRPPRVIRFRAEGDRVLNFEPGEDGLAVKRKELEEALVKQLFSSDRIRKISVPVAETKPSVDANSYGIKELIGEGVSNFAGSIPGRRHNIETAAGKLNGLLIAPAKVFSFNENVGEVSAATGYDYAYIISEGRTILGTGGGVCQVSTTVFRAALNSGLPVIKRTAHAYRVHYYEEGGFPVGFDSTVFAPSVDLQFRNDTGHYILVQSIFLGESDTLIFRFYGSKDGRVVKIEGPTILSYSPAPSPRYEDDPTLPRGEVRQVDFSADGAAVSFKRKVIRGNDLLEDDTFYSRYTPWQAVYLVGTKE